MRELGIQAIDDRLVRATCRDIQNELLFLEICIGREQHIIDSASSQEYSQKKGKDEYFENFFYHRIMIRILISFIAHKTVRSKTHRDKKAYRRKYNKPLGTLSLVSVRRFHDRLVESRIVHIRLEIFFANFETI